MWDPIVIILSDISSLYYAQKGLDFGIYGTFIIRHAQRIRSRHKGIGGGGGRGESKRKRQGVLGAVL